MDNKRKKERKKKCVLPATSPAHKHRKLNEISSRKSMAQLMTFQKHIVIFGLMQKSAIWKCFWYRINVHFSPTIKIERLNFEAFLTEQIIQFSFASFRAGELRRWSSCGLTEVHSGHRKNKAIFQPSPRLSEAKRILKLQGVKGYFHREWTTIIKNHES